MPLPIELRPVGQVANAYAVQNLFTDYRKKLSRNTSRRQDAELALFAKFLANASISVSATALATDAWRPVTWGLVSGFCRWQEIRGYAIGFI